MRHLFFSAFIFLSFSSLGQPGDIDLSVYLKSSIKFVIVNNNGDTISSQIIEDTTSIKKNKILIRHLDGIQDDVEYLLTSRSVEVGIVDSWSIDSSGIISDSVETKIEGFGAPDEWKKNSWAVHIYYGEQAMNIYINGSSNWGWGGPDPIPTFVICFFPGNYYLLAQPMPYLQNGSLVTHDLISLDELQPIQWEKLFKESNVRQDLGI